MPVLPLELSSDLDWSGADARCQPMMGAIRQLDVGFESEGRMLRGWLLLPGRDGPSPGVVMSSGFAGVKEGFLGNPFHTVMAEAGMAVLLYDHANTGSSDGEPRQELDPILQQRGYQDAITFLASRDEIDSGRIGIWGTSYSGGHVLAVAAHDRRVRAVVAQAMTISGHRNLLRRHTQAGYLQLQRSWGEERLRLAGGRRAHVATGLCRRQRVRPLSGRSTA